MDEILEILTKQADEEIMKYIERRSPVYSIGLYEMMRPAPTYEDYKNQMDKFFDGLLDSINIDIIDNCSYTSIVNEFGVVNRNDRIYKEYDPFICGQPLVILQPPKFLSDLWIDFLNDTKQLSFYRLRKTNELLKEVPTIHINGGVEYAIEVSKNKYEQTQRSRKNGVSSYGRSRPFWS